MICLLTRSADVVWQGARVAGPKRVDVQAATAGVARVDRQLDRFAARPDIHKNAFNALLMKLVVVSKAHQILQQAFLVDLRA